MIRDLFINSYYFRSREAPKTRKIKRLNFKTIKAQEYKDLVDGKIMFKSGVGGVSIDLFSEGIQSMEKR